MTTYTFNPDTATVDEWFNQNCSDKVLEEKYLENDFWTKNAMFYRSVKDMPMKHMSVKQVNWLVKIKEAVWKELE